MYYKLRKLRTRYYKRAPVLTHVKVVTPIAYRIILTTFTDP